MVREGGLQRWFGRGVPPKEAAIGLGHVLEARLRSRGWWLIASGLYLAAGGPRKPGLAALRLWMGCTQVWSFLLPGAGRAWMVPLWHQCRGRAPKQLWWPGWHRVASGRLEFISMVPVQRQGTVTWQVLTAQEEGWELVKSAQANRWGLEVANVSADQLGPRLAQGQPAPVSCG